MSKLVNIYLISLSLVTYFQKLIQAQHKREVRCDIFNIFYPKSRIDDNAIPNHETHKTKCMAEKLVKSSRRRLTF